jgi:CheY-like chemotaxis protein
MNAKILLVDDETDLVDLVAYNLRRRGHSVATASSGQEGMARVRQDPPDLIVLDITLPDIDSGSLHDLLRHQAATESIPVLLLSCLAPASLLEPTPSCQREGMLRQPGQLRILLDQIEEMLAKGRNHGEPGSRRLMTMR